MGTKIIPTEVFEKWYEKYNYILNDMTFPHSRRISNLDELFGLIEDDLIYSGCSAIEDKLQDGVQETIQILRESNIKIWMLTGDKIETSVEIAKSCNLLKSEKHIYLTSKHIYDFEKLQSEIPSISENLKISNDPYCIILDGKCLIYYDLLDSNLKKEFVKILTKSSTAICCRLTPKQKAKIVQIFKSHTCTITMCIGDGSNDVPMIMEANIGVGISGKEGSQAVRSADYSIPKFKDIKNLILVHGRYAYKRLSDYTCYAFYKNIIVVFTEIYFILFNGFSGQIFFSDWFTNLYNTFWSSWPMIINYSQDMDIDRSIIFSYPKLYTAGHKNSYMNKGVFWSWIVFAMFHGFVIFWIPIIVFLFYLDKYLSL
jgi:phospholipid-transporting ATPase